MLKKLQIEEIDKYNYNLIDNQNNKYKLNISFYGLEKEPKSGDYLLINEKLLKEYALLSFGPLDGIYGRQIKSSDDEDVVILLLGNDRIYLKRYYG